MRALVWHGKIDVGCDVVADPEIQDARDTIVKVTRCAICGSDLHHCHNPVPAMLPGDIIGHVLGRYLPTGWPVVVQCDGEPSDTAAVWGCA
jgi:threonine dehydrogenase-like Zn-dependent dehydrogenase